MSVLQNMPKIYLYFRDYKTNIYSYVRIILELLEEDWLEFQIWNLGIEKELDELKREKKEVKYQLKLVKNCIYERLDTAMGVIDEEEPVSGSGYIAVPEFGEVKSCEEVIGVMGRASRREGWLG